MMSGLFPDAASPPRNPGRQDDVGYVYADLDNAPGSSVVFFVSFGGCGPVVPLDTLVPGSVGSVCLEQSLAVPVGQQTLNAEHYAAQSLAVPAPVRLTLRGSSWAWQAVGLDATTGALRAARCVKQSV